MHDAIDLSCSTALALTALGLPIFYAAATARAHRILGPKDTRVLGPSSRWVRGALWVLEPFAGALAVSGVTANVVTGASLCMGAVAGLFAALGHFGAASVALAIASLGDAVDGLVARRTGTSSTAGAIFDAAADRYQEAIFLGGVAFFFREHGALVGVALAALVGSLMVSYGSAKAEALRVPVPYGIMRRTERAVTFVTGCVLTPACVMLGHRFGWSPMTGYAPIVVATFVVALLANGSAVHRLHIVAVARTTSTSKALAPSAAAKRT